MGRRLDARLFVGIARNAKYIPTIVYTIKNWPTYFLYYLGLRKGGTGYYFRNGATLRDKEGTASGTIAVVFIRKHYGSVAGKSVIVEIGANIGTFAIYAATTNPHARVYSYEPIRANYEVLVNNVMENGYRDRIKTFNLGVASTSGKREFYLASSPEHSLIKGDGAAASVIIDCLSLPDILRLNGLTKVDLLKVNCEGAEYEILYSTPKECFDKIDEIRMEYHGQTAETHDLTHLMAFLKQFGYENTYLYEHLRDEGFLWMKRNP